MVWLAVCRIPRSLVCFTCAVSSFLYAARAYQVAEEYFDKEVDVVEPFAGQHRHQSDE